jgi:hypothetical protein
LAKRCEPPTVALRRSDPGESPTSLSETLEMFLYLKALALRLARRALGGLPPALPEDPPVGVREPRKRGPGGKSSAVALVEPAERGSVRAYGPGQRDGRIRQNANPDKD